MGEIRIGTSGWNYPSGKGAWNGLFYPATRSKRDGTKDFDELRFYAEHFDTVEVNATFYRLQKRETFERWAQDVPADFRFSIKAHRRLTHGKSIAPAGEQGMAGGAAVTADGNINVGSVTDARSMRLGSWVTAIAADLASTVGDGARVYTGGEAFSNRVPKLSPTEGTGRVAVAAFGRHLLCAAMQLNRFRPSVCHEFSFSLDICIKSETAKKSLEAAVNCL